MTRTLPTRPLTVALKLSLAPALVGSKAQRR